jgi:hypothetical protein
VRPAQQPALPTDEKLARDAASEWLALRDQGEYVPCWDGAAAQLVMHELYPSKEALDAAGAGMAGGMDETFEQLDELLVALGVTG